MVRHCSVSFGSVRINKWGLAAACLMESETSTVKFLVALRSRYAYVPANIERQVFIIESGRQPVERGVKLNLDSATHERLSQRTRLTRLNSR